MGFLVVGGAEIPTALDGSRMDRAEIGDRDRAPDGSERATVWTTKRTWHVRTRPVTTAEAATIRTALTAAPFTTASGDWLGESVTVWPVLGVETPVMVHGGFRLVMEFALEED